MATMSPVVLWTIVGVVVVLVLLALLIIFGLHRRKKNTVSFESKASDTEEKKRPDSGNYQAKGGFNFAAGPATGHKPSQADVVAGEFGQTKQAKKEPEPVSAENSASTSKQVAASETSAHAEKPAPQSTEPADDSRADEAPKSPDDHVAGVTESPETVDREQDEPVVPPADEAVDDSADKADEADKADKASKAKAADQTFENETQKTKTSATSENAVEDDKTEPSAQPVETESSSQPVETESPAEPVVAASSAQPDDAEAEDSSAQQEPALDSSELSESALTEKEKTEAEEAAAAAQSVAVGVEAAAVLARESSTAEERPSSTESTDEGTAAVAEAELEEPAETPEPIDGRIHRLRGRLSRSQNAIGKGVLGILGGGDLDEDAWEDVEDTLVMADLGTAATMKVVDSLREKIAFQGVSSEQEARALLRQALIESCHPEMDRSIRAMPYEGKPAVILVVGVNGTGKTTTAGKLARVLTAMGHSVLLGAADTFRAAAADQLEAWGSRVNARTVRGPEGADPASVAFDAVAAGVADHADVVVLDTAGRLHTKNNLMDQLGKVKRVVEKKAVVDEVLLVLDATVGQNGLVQARIFAETVDITGVVLTKLDGTAKGGIVFQVQEELGVPVKMVGLGEGVDDLAPFEVEGFVDALLG